MFSPDGQFILTCSRDKTARLWESYPLYISAHWTLNAVDFLHAGAEIDIEKVMATGNPSELAALGGEYFERNDYKNAQRCYEKSEGIEHSAGALISLCRIAEKTRQTFDFQRFLSSNKAEELRQYGDYFEQKADQMDSTRTSEKMQALGNADRLFEKSEGIEHSAEALITLDRIAEKTGQAFDFQRFIASNNAKELRQYGDYFSQIQKEKYREHVPDCMKAVHIGEKLLSLDTSFVTRKAVGAWYNELAYNQLFVPDGAGAEASIRQGMTLDPENLYLVKKLPTAFMLQGRYAEAEKLYLEYKDKPLGTKTFKDNYLEDLKNLEAQGVSHPDFVRVRALLEGGEK